ncbi:MAG: hypothetical protein HGA38_02205 [Candidatus Moranbacteria bacterium]|nr:hypothetical protein [Candidatus Moranbacteria bacterium]
MGSLERKIRQMNCYETEERELERYLRERFSVPEYPEIPQDTFVVPKSKRRGCRRDFLDVDGNPVVPKMVVHGGTESGPGRHFLLYPREKVAKIVLKSGRRNVKVLVRLGLQARFEVNEYVPESRVSSNRADDGRRSLGMAKSIRHPGFCGKGSEYRE